MTTTVPPIATEFAPAKELPPRPRKWDAEIDTARRSDAWLTFEADIHESAVLRSRVARALDRFGLGTSDVIVDDTLDYLIHKELGASAHYFNQTGKAQFNQQQITHAVLSFMSGKEAQRHMTDLVLFEDEGDYDAKPLDGVRTSNLPDQSQIAPDEYAARVDAVRVIRSMIPHDSLELFDLWLAARGSGPRGELGTLNGLHAYAQRCGIALSTVYFRMEQLAYALQRHPWFDELTRPFRPEGQTDESTTEPGGHHRRRMARS